MSCLAQRHFCSPASTASSTLSSSYCALTQVTQTRTHHMLDIETKTLGIVSSLVRAAAVRNMSCPPSAALLLTGLYILHCLTTSCCCCALTQKLHTDLDTPHARHGIVSGLVENMTSIVTDLPFTIFHFKTHLKRGEGGRGGRRQGGGGWGGW